MRPAAVLLALLLCPARAEIRLHALFSDDMVLQREIAVPVWGTGEPGAGVTVSIDGQKKNATVGEDGRWSVTLDPMKAGGPHELAVGDRALKNVMVGDVWVCGGQSNMSWALQGSAPEDASDRPRVRLFTVPQKRSLEPREDVEGRWAVCTAANARAFSAVGYYFGAGISEKVDVAVGLIHSSWGGTQVEPWTSAACDPDDPEMQGWIDQWKKERVENPEEAPKCPRRIARLYNAMIHPLTRFPIKGVIWYQGESNVGRAEQYRRRFPVMIRDWRRAWGIGDFPFLFVQLANFLPRKELPGESHWAALREAQLQALSVPRTGMAVAIDIGEAKDIHPKNKKDVGRRLALSALAVAYGREVVHSGPIFDSMKIEGGRIRLSFKHVGGGLVARGEKLKGFAVAGEDGAFVWADAQIEGEQVLVSSSGVVAPVAVRYAWADNPDCNLYNREGLPASPFRSN
jgi:sialate O-acetylesterase